MNTIDFIVRSHAGYISDDVLEVVPVVDGTELSELVTNYEIANGFDHPDEYGGIVPEFFNYGSLSDYYLGAANNPYWAEKEKISLLGCDHCGEFGCGPLNAAVEVTATTVTWSNFEDPYLKTNDYSRFGPFTFDREKYDQAVAAVIHALEH